MFFRSIAPLLVLLLSACAHGAAQPIGQGQRSDPLADTAWRPDVEHQRCAVLPVPVGSVDQLVDSVRVIDAVRSMHVTGGHILWSIAFDGNGILAQVRSLEESLPEAVAAALSDAVRAAARSQRGESFVRLRLDVAGGAGARLRVAGAQYCPATLVDMDAVRLAMAAADRAGQLEVRLYVDQNGSVQDSELLRSSGDETTDRMVLGLVSSLKYSPARLERRPVPARVIYRVDLD